MPQLKYGDCVVLVQKSRDPQTKEVSVQRTNAFVMRSVVQPEGAEKFSPAKVQSTQALKGPNTQPLPGGEYLDLMYPRPLPNGQTSTTVQMPELIFGRAHAVAPWKEGAFIGWELPRYEDGKVTSGLPTAGDLDAVAADDAAPAPIEPAAPTNSKKNKGVWGK